MRTRHNRRAVLSMFAGACIGVIFGISNLNQVFAQQQSEVVTGQVLSAVGQFLSAAPDSVRADIGKVLNYSYAGPNYDPKAFIKITDSLGAVTEQNRRAFNWNNHASPGSKDAIENLVHEIAPEFARKLANPKGREDEIDVSVGLSLLYAHVSHKLPETHQQLKELKSAAELVNRHFSVSKEAIEIMDRTVEALLHELDLNAVETVRASPAISQGFSPRRFSGSQLLPSVKRSELAAGVRPLNGISGAELLDAKSAIVQGAMQMHLEALKEGRGGIFPIVDELFDAIVRADRSTGLSQVYRDDQGKILGFALAYFDPRRNTVELEKLGVLREHRKEGISKKMLHALAERAHSLGMPIIELLDLKNNFEAIPVYEKLGFENTTPREAYDNPKYNAYRFAIPVARLLETTNLMQKTDIALPDRFTGGKASNEGNRLSTWVRTHIDTFFGEKPEQIFTSAYPRSTAPKVLRKARLNFSEVVSEILHDRVFHNPTALYPLRFDYPHMEYNGTNLARALREILDFADTSGKDRRAMEFVTQLAQFKARNNFKREVSNDLTPYRWPDNPLKTGEYWDLAAGPNAADWILAGLNPTTEYRLFDVSDYVVAYLQETIDLARKRGLLTAKVTAEKADIRQLKPPEKPLAVIRAKGVDVYVAGGVYALAKMVDWIAEGGQLVLETNPDTSHRMGSIGALGPLIERLTFYGWRFEFRWGERTGSHLDVDTLILTKPPKDWATSSRRQQAVISMKAWENYKTRVASNLRQVPSD